MQTMTAGETRPGRRLPALAAMTAVALLFSGPFLLCWYLDAGFLNIANEPLAYRFFYPERILAGETLAVGVGYLVSVVHHAVYAAIHLFPSVAGGTLESRLDLFAITTNGVLSLLVGMMLLAAAWSRRLTASDLALLALVSLAPIYGTVYIGFYYAMLADYHFLNIVICIATLLLFQLIWRREQPVSRATVLLLGAFAGLVAANKITMVILAGVVLVPAVLYRGAGWREIAIRIALAAAGLVTAFLAVHLISYLGDYSRMRASLRIWWAFAKRPGGEPAFWDHIVETFIVGYNYRYWMSFSGIMLGLALIAMPFRHRHNREAWLVTLYCTAAIMVCLYFVAKRPAGSTLFDSNMMSFTLAAVILTVHSAWRPVRAIVVIACAGWLVLAVSTFLRDIAYGMVARSRADADIKWAAFHAVLKMAGSRPIEVIFPDNSYRHEGPFELLLKASADFPSSWTINAGQNTVLDRYAPTMSFRNNNGRVKPWMPYGHGRALVWFDKEGQSLEGEYAELAKALARPEVKRYQPQGYSSFRTMHIAEIPEAVAQPGPR
jgi:hypothetical protein